MSRPKFRNFIPGVPHHCFTKANDGSIIFYSVKDCLFYITLYSCIARKYKVMVSSFSLMPNHIHSLEHVSSENALVSFHRDVESQFALDYNTRHGTEGALFQPKFGFAPKRVGKAIRSCVCYISNNASVGNIETDPFRYRWNLLAYHGDDHPFSEKILLRFASARMRRSVSLVKALALQNKPLTYQILDIIFKGLDESESRQITDRIISLYNFMDYKTMSSYFDSGKFSSAALAIKSMSGSDNELDDDWDDYSVYGKMSRLLAKHGYDLEYTSFLSEEVSRAKAVKIFEAYGFQKRHICKYLHISVEGKWLIIKE